MNKELLNFIQSNSPDGGFLQSEEWRKFQESTGRKTYNISAEDFWANIIEHELPVVGKYFYAPRGPVIPVKAGIHNGALNSGSEAGMTKLIELAKENKAGWIRIEPANNEILENIKNYIRPRRTRLKIRKAPHDMQPKEIFMLDIAKSEDDILAGMKQKTRYNIRLAEKKSVKVISYQLSDINKKYIDEFVRLVKITAGRDKITPHPESYYRKMFENIPGEILKLYIAEYEGKIIAANIILFFGKTATYLHGASDNEHRNAMAPYLLQWQAIQDAKKAGCEKYDFGGVNTKTGQGITKFKIGFASNASNVEFPGSFDIIISPLKYRSYRIIQKIKSLSR